MTDTFSAFSAPLSDKGGQSKTLKSASTHPAKEGPTFDMEEGYELDLTYITERIIAVSFPRGCLEEIYAHNLKDVTRMLKSKHADNYLIINLSEKRHDLSRMNPKTLDTGWPDMHAPPLDKICTICKAMESWLNADPLHVVVIHCRGGKGRIGVVISSFVNFTDVSASADQALDRFAMRKYYDDKVSALMTPSQKRYVWILNSLLSGSMKINASPLFLHCVILHGIPNFESSGVCRPYVKVYQGMQAVYSSGIYHIGPGHRGRICVTLEPAQLLKGDIMMKCYHKSEVSSERDVIFQLQFHTGAVQGYKLMFDKEDMEAANKDPRFPEYGKVEVFFSEGPEKIPGADRWHNGVDVTVDYNTADPLIRWDSYQNMCDAEAPRSQGLSQDKAAPKKTPNGGDTTLGLAACTTSATSSPDHSDHALSVSSDSGLSSTSIWADRPTPSSTSVTSVTVRSNQGPSQQEKVQLQRLLSGFGVEDPSLEEMDEPPPRVGIHQTVPAQVRINGVPSRGPQERETDILDDEVITGQDLHSVDSFGTLSSSCHKSSQNSLLSDGFGSPGGEEQQSQSQTRLHHPAPSPMDDYERHYSEARRGHVGSRSNSVATSNPSSTSVPKQHVYRQGSYSTQSWVRQQQMVAAQQLIYMPEDGNNTERYPENKQRNGSPKEGLTLEQQDTATASLRCTAPHKEQATLNNNNNNKRDDEFKSLTMDIDNSIDQLNQLIMDLDPTFMPLSSQSSSIKRNGGAHVNGSASKCSNGIDLRFCENNMQRIAAQSNEGDVTRSLSRQASDVTDHSRFCSSGWTGPEEYRGSQRTYSPCAPQSQHTLLCRSDSGDYRAQGPDTDSGVEAGCDMTPATPAFPISPPTPYESQGYSEMINHAGVDVSNSTINIPGTQNATHSASIVGSRQRTGGPSVTQHPVLNRQASLTSFPSKRQAPLHSTSLDYGHQHVHPAPNAHSSPRSGQRSRMASYALSHSPAQSFDEQDDLGLGYSSHCPTPALMLGNGSLERDILASLDGNQSQPLQMQPPHLPEKKRVSDGEHGGTASPVLSGFSSPHSGSSLSIPFPNVLPDLSARTATTDSPLPDVLASKQVTVKFVQDTSKFWYKPDISRDQAISVLKDKEPGCFIVRDSHSFRGAYGLAMKVATAPPSVLQQSKKGGELANELVRHFLIECTQKGVRLKGCPNEPYFGSLTALVCQHSITPLALPCKLIIPDRGQNVHTHTHICLHWILLEYYVNPIFRLDCFFFSLTCLRIFRPSRRCGGKHVTVGHQLCCRTTQTGSRSFLRALGFGFHSMVQVTQFRCVCVCVCLYIACNVWYLGSVDMESLTGVQAVQKATGMTLSSNPPPTSTVVHFKVSSQGITLTDNQRKLFFRRHYNVNTVIFCALDPQDRKWKRDGCTSAKIFGFVARKSGTSMDNVCHLFAEHDPEQPARAIVNFVSKVMIGSLKSK
ncbi:tensin-3-like isoform X3 [Phyllopteryx taeniolatus]|uniref:tensin-3-like isoform X3 n=1 Tax=Phyllopteryx taeniolatus TaxID=161469 RepID=UPI002AD29B8C|nr:tensin-3-like isoform X3 [Phyllopteryx taeniolatus]